MSVSPRAFSLPLYGALLLMTGCSSCSYHAHYGSGGSTNTSSGGERVVVEQHTHSGGRHVIHGGAVHGGPRPSTDSSGGQQPGRPVVVVPTQPQTGGPATGGDSTGSGATAGTGGNSGTGSGAGASGAGNGAGGSSAGNGSSGNGSSGMGSNAGGAGSGSSGNNTGSSNTGSGMGSVAGRPLPGAGSNNNAGLAGGAAAASDSGHANSGGGMGAVASANEGSEKGNGMSTSSPHAGVAGRQPTSGKPGEATNRPVRPTLRAPIGKRPATTTRKDSADKTPRAQDGADKQTSGNKKDGAQQVNRQRTSSEKKR